jgi:general stress protein 26
MEKEEALRKSTELVQRSKIALLGTNGEDGYPNIKAMLVPEHEGLKRIWFSTNTSSRRVGQLRREPKACVYFVDFQVWQGLMLVGRMEILSDGESRRRLWHPGDEQYYPQGVDDPDYTVLRFTAEWGNYYHALANVTFTIG